MEDLKAYILIEKSGEKLYKIEIASPKKIKKKQNQEGRSNKLFKLYDTLYNERLQINPTRNKSINSL